MRNPFPLQWPDGWRRTPVDERKPSRFFYGFTDSLSSVLDEFRKIGAENVVVTSDLPTRRDGRPYASGRAETGDSGIAVWFVLQGQERVWACESSVTRIKRRGSRPSFVTAPTCEATSCQEEP